MDLVKDSPLVTLFEVAVLPWPAGIAHAGVSHAVSVQSAVQVAQFYQNNTVETLVLVNNSVYKHLHFYVPN